MKTQGSASATRPPQASCTAREVTDLVAEVGELIETQFPDLKFVDPGGTIDIREHLGSVTTVRLELPGQAHLHLASVIIDADGVDDLSASTELTTSSSWKDYDKTLQSGLLFDPENREIAFHTKEEYRPWLEIQFNQPVDIRQIYLRNRKGSEKTRARARGIQVRCRTEQGQWSTVYDGIEREHQLYQVVERVHGPVTEVDAEAHTPSATSPDVSGDLARILASIHLGDYHLLLPL